ncbi:MAG: hypothetical protein KGR26_04655, partial [Cyanobacteria bacterium REEB65]|nr:hypothetical protein [Cyanobacteria bacterium REEB65]
MRNVADRRIACILVPTFQLAAILRAMPELAGQPVAILAGHGTHAKVAHASPEALTAGVAAGLGATRAKQRIANLIALAPSTEAESSAQAALLEIAFAFSPRVEDAGPGEAYLDLGDRSSSLDSESTVATRLDSALQRIKLPCRIGIGPCKTIARIAARASDGVQVVPAGGEISFMAPIPLAALDLSPTLADLLAGWGIRTLGELAALDTKALARRLGPEGVRLQQLARGREERPFWPTLPDLVYEEAISFDDWQIRHLEQLYGIAQELIERLVTRLRARGLAARGLTLTMALDPPGNDVRYQEFAAPLT